MQPWNAQRIKTSASCRVRVESWARGREICRMSVLLSMSKWCGVVLSSARWRRAGADVDGRVGRCVGNVGGRVAQQLFGPSRPWRTSRLALPRRHDLSRCVTCGKWFRVASSCCCSEWQPLPEGSTRDLEHQPNSMVRQCCIIRRLHHGEQARISIVYSSKQSTRRRHHKPARDHRCEGKNYWGARRATHKIDAVGSHRSPQRRPSLPAGHPQTRFPKSCTRPSRSTSCQNHLLS